MPLLYAHLSRRMMALLLPLQHPYAAYMALGYTRFLSAHRRHRYGGAAIWARRLAEAFCIAHVRPKYQDCLLDGLAWHLPWGLKATSAWAHTCSQGTHVSTPALEHAREVGVFCCADPLEWGRWHIRAFGNLGAHAHAAIRGAPRGPNDKVFAARLRILLVYAHVVYSNSKNRVCNRSQLRGRQ